MGNPVWTVTDVKTEPEFCLLLKFENGETKRYDVKPLLKKELYRKLNNPDYYRKAKAFCGTVVWDENTDIAPEYLYANSTPV